jgi:hypothetical protein
MLDRMGQEHHIASCPRCGRTVKLALLPGASAPFGLQCVGCDKSDPLKSKLVTGWLNGELGRPRLTVIEPK